MQQFDEGGEVRVLVEDGAPAIASVEDMVTIASLGGAWVARHGRHYRVLVGERQAINHAVPFSTLLGDSAWAQRGWQPVEGARLELGEGVQHAVFTLYLMWRFPDQS